MAKYGVTLKIDVTKIDKARLFKGQKGTYLDATVFIDTDNVSEYGDNGMITQDVTKEERDQKVQGNILGNAKVFWTEGGQAPQNRAPAQQAANQPTQYQQNNPTPSGAGGGLAPVDDFDDDIPFMPLHWMHGG